MNWNRRTSLLILIAAATMTPRIASAQSESGPPDPQFVNSGGASQGGFAGQVNATGGYSQSVPLDLPADRGGLPVPVQLVYGGRGVGAAGIGWDVPLAYVRRDTTTSHRLPTLDGNQNA